MQDTVQTAPATFTGQEPAVVPDRTITYPLRSGGVLVHACPEWCTDDHSGEIETGLTTSEDLQHTGAPISLGFDVDGGRDHILEARMVQWPFAQDESKPYIDLVPEASTGEGIVCTDPLMVSEQVRKVRAHLRALEQLADQLAEAQAVDHAAHSQESGTPWESFTRTDLLALPIAYLLKVFGVTVVETEDIGCKAVLALYGEPGSMEMRVLPDVSQHLREDQARQRLLGWHEAKRGARRV